MSFIFVPNYIPKLEQAHWLKDKLKLFLKNNWRSLDVHYKYVFNIISSTPRLQTDLTPPLRLV